MKNILCLAAFCSAAPLALADITYFDTILANADWQSTVLQQGPAASFTANGIGSFGNNFVSIIHNYTAPAGQLLQRMIHAQIRPSFVWNPAVDGPLLSMDFSADARHNGSFGFSTPAGMSWRPVILQGGVTYSVLSSSLIPALDGLYHPLVWNFTNTSNWVDFATQSLVPDFTASGAPIQFGYRAESGIDCGAALGKNCNNGGVFGFLDNYQVQLKGPAAPPPPPPGVPEPSTWALMTIAAAGLAARQKLLRRTAM